VIIPDSYPAIIKMEQAEQDYQKHAEEEWNRGQNTF